MLKSSLVSYNTATHLWQIPTQYGGPQWGGTHTQTHPKARIIIHLLRNVYTMAVGVLFLRGHIRKEVHPWNTSNW